MSPGG